MRVTLTILSGVIISVLFDAFVHGLSSHGHGFLNSIFENNPAQRTTPPKIMGNISWHIFADIFIGVALCLLLILINQNNIKIWIIVGLITGLLMAFEWIHMYAENEIKWEITVTLGVLVVIKSVLVSAVAGNIYYGNFQS